MTVVGGSTVELSPAYFKKICEQLRQLGSVEELHLSSPLSACDTALEILIATMLTQATTDRNAMRAWLRFKENYSHFDQVISGGVAALSEVIRPAGMAGQRSVAIIGVLHAVKERWGEYTLEPLAADPKLAWDFLNSLPKVGPKTTACVMLFGFDIPFFPVDVHIERIAKRLGWAGTKQAPAVIQQELTKLIPPELHRELHILMLNLGRIYCRPKQPKCEGCPVCLNCKLQMGN